MSDIFTNPYTAYSATPGVGDWIVRIDLDDLDAAAGTLTIRATVAGRTVNGGSANRAKDLTETTACIFVPITAAAGEAVVVTVQSNLAADSAGVTVASAATNSVRQTIDAGSSDHYQAVANTIVGRKIWHVAKTGNDANDGKSYDTAFLTIAAAVAACGQGDEIVVWASGTDYDEAVDLSALTGITLQVMRGATVTYDADSTIVLGDYCGVVGNGIIACTSAESPAIIASEKSGCYVVGVFIDAAARGIQFFCVAHARIEGNKIDAREFGINLLGSGEEGPFLIEDNTVMLRYWTACWSIGIYAKTGGRVSGNTIDVLVAGATVSNVAVGLQLGTDVLSFGNLILSESHGVANSYGLVINTATASSMNDFIRSSSSFGDDYDLKVDDGVLSIKSDYRDSTGEGTIIDLGERSVANVMDDAIPDSPTVNSINERLKTVDNDLADGGRLDLILDDIPTTAEFEARTIVAAAYFIVGDYTAPDNAGIAAAKAAAEAVDTLTKADGDGDLAEVASNVAETLATMPSAATIAAAVWDATTRTLSSFGTLVASIWAAASRTLTGSTLGLGPTASRSRTDGYYTCPQSGTIGLYRRILGWDGADLQQADVQSIAYSIFALSDDDPPERTAVEGHKDVELDKIAVLFDEVQSDEWASDYNFKHIPDISTNQAFPEADAHYLVEYRLTPTAGQVIVERIKVRAI